MVIFWRALVTPVVQISRTDGDEEISAWETSIRSPTTPTNLKASLGLSRTPSTFWKDAGASPLRPAGSTPTQRVALLTLEPWWPSAWTDVVWRPLEKNSSICGGPARSTITTWWLGHPSEKYEFVNWEDDIPNIWEHKKWQPNHQPDKSWGPQGFGLDGLRITSFDLGFILWWNCHCWQHMSRGQHRPRCGGETSSPWSYPKAGWFIMENLSWLVVWTPLKNISQLGWFFLIYGKIKNVPNHQPASINGWWLGVPHGTPWYRKPRCPVWFEQPWQTSVELSWT